MDFILYKENNIYCNIYALAFLIRLECNPNSRWHPLIGDWLGEDAPEFGINSCAWVLLVSMALTMGVASAFFCAGDCSNR